VVNSQSAKAVSQPQPIGASRGQLLWPVLYARKNRQSPPTAEQSAGKVFGFKRRKRNSRAIAKMEMILLQILASSQLLERDGGIAQCSVELDFIFYKKQNHSVFSERGEVFK